MKITVHELSPEELKDIIQNMMHEEFDRISEEIQLAFGEDDLISTGSACRLLGVSTKYFKILIDDGVFTVYHHLKERRFLRGEILAYRNRYKTNKKRG